MLKEVLTGNGETIAYRERGKGPLTFVMLHGNMTSGAHLDILMERMPAEVRVIAPDLRGFGGSSYNHPVNSLRDFAEDVVQLLDMLKVDKFMLGGWSTGGGVALEIAAEHPKRVQKLVLVESVGIDGYPISKKDENGQPIPGVLLKTRDEVARDAVQVLPILNAYENRDKETLRAIWNALIYTHNKPDDKRYEIYLEDMLTQRNLVDVDYALMTFNMTDSHNGVVPGSGRIHNVKAPALIFQGDRDHVVPPAMGNGIKAGLGDLARMVTGDWGHSPFIDDPDTLMREIKKFIF